jgi:DNA-directed RNA polymerase subunit RPC12/RpoP
MTYENRTAHIHNVSKKTGSPLTYHCRECGRELGRGYYSIILKAEDELPLFAYSDELVTCNRCGTRQPIMSVFLEKKDAEELLNSIVARGFSSIRFELPPWMTPDMIAAHEQRKHAKKTAASSDIMIPFALQMVQVRVAMSRTGFENGCLKCRQIKQHGNYVVTITMNDDLFYVGPEPAPHCCDEPKNGWALLFHSKEDAEREAHRLDALIAREQSVDGIHLIKVVSIPSLPPRNC